MCLKVRKWILNQNLRTDADSTFEDPQFRTSDGSRQLTAYSWAWSGDQRLVVGTYQQLNKFTRTYSSVAATQSVSSPSLILLPTRRDVDLKTELFDIAYSEREHSPLIRLRHMALYKFDLIDWLIDRWPHVCGRMSRCIVLKNASVAWQ